MFSFLPTLPDNLLHNQVCHSHLYGNDSQLYYLQPPCLPWASDCYIHLPPRHGFICAPKPFDLNQLCLFWFHILFPSTCKLFVPCAVHFGWIHLPPRYPIKTPVNFNSSFCLIIHIKAILMIFINWRFLESIPSPCLSALPENRTSVYSPTSFFMV